MIWKPLGSMTLLLGQIALLFPSLLWGENVAVVSLEHPKVSSRETHRWQREVEKELRAERGKEIRIVSLSPQDIHSKLTPILNRELTEAKEAYYHLELQKSIRLLAGRFDSDALLLRAQVTLSEGDEKEAEEWLMKRQHRFPSASLPEREVPPQLVKLSKKIVSPAGGRGARGSAAVTLGGHEFPAEEAESWFPRLRRWCEEEGWQGIFLLGMEAIGWNQKVTAWWIGTDGERSFSVEIKGLGRIKEAAEIVVDKTYFVDTPRKFQ